MTDLFLDKFLDRFAVNPPAIPAGDQNVMMRQAGFRSNDDGVMQMSLLCEAVFRHKKRE